MPTYERFEDLPVWRAAMNLGLGVFQLTERKAFGHQGDLRNQLQRAALSISNNIAEGFERGTTAELLMFLYIARGSAGEVRSMLRFCAARGRFRPLESEISNLISQSEGTSRQIRGWADSLQNSDIKGQRHLNEHARAAYDKRQRVDELMEHVREIQRHAAEGNHHPEAEP